MDILKEVRPNTCMSIVGKTDLQVFRSDGINQTVQLQKFKFNESLNGYALYDHFEYPKYRYLLGSRQTLCETVLIFELNSECFEYLKAFDYVYVF